MNPSAFMAFVVNQLKFPLGNQRPPDVSDYERSLADPAKLKMEMVSKLADRYSCSTPPERLMNKSLRSTHSLLRANADFNDVRPDRSEATGHFVGASYGGRELCLREKWREVMSRDILLASRQITGRCVYVARGYERDARLIADEAAKACQSAITLMSDCAETLEAMSESADYYHHAVLTPSVEAYLAMPRLFQSFVLVGGSGALPPLCKARERCWHYLPDSVPSSAAEERAYTLVCGG